MRRWLGIPLSMSALLAMAAASALPAQQDRLIVVQGKAAVAVKAVGKGEAPQEKADDKAKDEVKKQVAKDLEAKKEAQKAAVQKAAVQIRQQLAGVARRVENEEMIKQNMQQFRPYLRSELHVLQRVCDLSDEQARALNRDLGDAALRGAARKFIEAQSRPDGGGMYRGEPGVLVQDALLEAAKGHLTDEQLQRYKDEAEAQTADRKRVAARNVVAILDRELMLSAEQRDKLIESLSEGWEDTWVTSLQVLEYGTQFFPNIPDKFVLPHLNDAQKKIWQRIPKNQSVFFGIGNEVDNSALEPEAGDDQAADEAVPLKTGLGPRADLIQARVLIFRAQAKAFQIQQALRA
jgi:hypothetical protein